MAPMEDILALEKATAEAPHKREAQKFLARELTSLIHGEEELQKVEKATEALFAGKLKELDKPMLLEAFSEAPSVTVSKSQIGQLNVVDLFVESGLIKSKGQARKDIQGGGVYINSIRVESPDKLIESEDLLHNTVLVLRKGKKNYCLVLFS